MQVRRVRLDGLADFTTISKTNETLVVTLSSVSRVLLLSGSPGSGKTMLAKALGLKLEEDERTLARKFGSSSRWWRSQLIKIRTDLLVDSLVTSPQERSITIFRSSPPPPLQPSSPLSSSSSPRPTGPDPRYSSSTDWTRFVDRRWRFVFALPNLPRYPLSSALFGLV